MPQAQTAPIWMVGAAPEDIRVGKIVYAVLLTKRKACNIVHLTSRRAGAEESILLHAKYAGSSGARPETRVRDVVCPRQHWLANASAGKDFLTSLIEWETKSATFCECRQSWTMLLSLWKRRAMSSPLDQRRGVDALKLWIREASFVLPGFFQGQVPMQVNAVGGWQKGH